MKTYVYEMGWRGCMIIVAESKEEALKLLRPTLLAEDGAPAEDELEEVMPNTTYRCWGDE